MKGYVIYLSSEKDALVRDQCNVYGYWEGKQYTVHDEIFPVTFPRVTIDTKVYKSKKRADTAAEKLFNKFGYVLSWLVEEI
jgi:hypothetical protein